MFKWTIEIKRDTERERQRERERFKNIYHFISYNKITLNNKNSIDFDLKI